MKHESPLLILHRPRLLLLRLRPHHHPHLPRHHLLHRLLHRLLHHRLPRRPPPPPLRHLLHCLHFGQ